MAETKMVRMEALRGFERHRLDGEGTEYVRRGEEFDTTPRQAEFYARQRTARAVGGRGAPPDETKPPKALTDAGAAVDLREVPLRSLDVELDRIEDVKLIRTLLKADDRAGATAKYERRIAELETKE